METNFFHRNEEEHRSQTESKTGLEFATAEAAIQHDREANPPPPEIAERLNQSIANEPKPDRGTSFWAKLGFRKE